MACLSYFLKGIIMNHVNPNLPATHCDYHPPRIGWSSILAGALVGVGLGFLLHLFSVAIGLSAYSSSADGAKIIAIGGILGLLIGVIASMGVAGFVAGYLGRYHYCHCHGGVIYGFLTWSIALLLSAIFVIPLTHYMSSYTNDLAPSAVITKPVTQALNDNATNDTLSERNIDRTTAQPTPTEKEAFAWSAWIVFVLFFIGALASCIGACCGMSCRRHTEVHPEIHDTKGL
jgi:uncharacterized membrane protein